MKNEGVTTRIRSTLRHLRILAMMEHAPKYARQIARIHPHLFFSDDWLLTEKRAGLPAAHIYMTFGRLERAGLIEKAKGYKPPEGVAKNHRRITWYRLTAKGRKLLREARESLYDCIGENHA